MARQRKAARRTPPRSASHAIVVGDPDPLARAALVQALRGEARLHVAGEAETPDQLVEQARLLHPRFVLLAAAFPGLVPMAELIRDLRREHSPLAVVVISVPGGRQDAVAAFHAGATGYVIKDTTMRWLGPMLRRYLDRGTPPLSPGISNVLVAELRAGADLALEGGAPSERELEVLHLVGKGLTNREIAEALGVSGSTVKSHIHSLLRKLDVTNRVQLALRARHRKRTDREHDASVSKHDE